MAAESLDRAIEAYEEIHDRIGNLLASYNSQRCLQASANAAPEGSRVPMAFSAVVDGEVYEPDVIEVDADYAKVAAIMALDAIEIQLLTAIFDGADLIAEACGVEIDDDDCESVVIEEDDGEYASDEDPADD